LDRLEEEVKDLERETVQSINNTTQEITQYVDQSITNITGNAELLIGDVVTYTPASNTGTVDIAGAVVNFVNAASVKLEVGDTIILSANEDYPDPFAVGLVYRSGGPLGYDQYEFISPSGIPGLPRTSSSFGVATQQYNPAFLVYGTAGYTIDYDAFTLIAEDWVAATRTVTSLPTAIRPSSYSSTTFSFCTDGTILAVASASTAGKDALAVNDGTTWVTHDYGYVMLGKRPSSGSLWGVAGQKLISSVWTAGIWLLEIDGTGAVTDTDLTSTMTTGGTVNNTKLFCASGDGHVVVGHGVGGGSGNTIYVDGTVHPYTFGAAGTMPVLLEERFSKEIYGDKLYYIYRSGAAVSDQPSVTGAAQVSSTDDTIGIGAMDLTSPTLATITYPTVTTVSGLWKDGELRAVTTIAVLDGPKVAYGGSIALGVFDAAYAANAAQDPSRPAVVVYDIANSTTSIYATSDSRVFEYHYTSSATGTTNTRPRMEDYSNHASVGAEPGSSDLISAICVQAEISSGVYVQKDWLEGLTL